MYNIHKLNFRHEQVVNRTGVPHIRQTDKVVCAERSVGELGVEPWRDVVDVDCS